MKIYWIQPGEINSISGGYIYNKNIIENIRAQSVNVELFNPGSDFPFPSKISIDNCRNFFLKIKSSSIVIIDSLVLGTIPDLIEEFTPKLCFTGMIHLPLSLSPSLSDDHKKFIKPSEINSFKHSELLIVTSDFTKSEIMKMGIKESKIHVVEPGINSVIDQKSYPEKPVNLLCVSRISKTKGQLDLIKALEKLQQYNWKLTFCGGYDKQDEYYKEIKHQISISGMENRINFTGEVYEKEVEKYYKVADLLILTSCFETYSMVLQEAMAFKIPIIAANSGAVNQTANPLVTKFYTPGAVDQLCERLSTIFRNSNEYKKLTDGYSKLNLKFINWNAKAEQFLNILVKNNET